MLELKHLTKIYKTKGGEDTRALDDVSISFDRTGLVFLLGKSGSGKSTLLNLAGGLDEPTSGEVIVMGKSSKDFSGGDFDSYRNTFVGFIFQEYNILNEFNVEDNIALALELQGKKKDREKIGEILRDVELEDFAKRKPNTLSGGQKQRIAIARALVKDPQIIMADEPTGALDSTTGKQVFETLKKLSATRLVIVVSHDREFAETYGDRIVELKDGKIVSDETKVREEAKVSGAIVRHGDDTLTVHRGGPLSRQELAAIEAFLTEGEGDVIISRGEKDVASFRRAAHIDDEGAREKFRDTPEKAPEAYDGSKTKFIRSRLPAGKAIRIGASGLRLKPFRLLMTILLSVVSFILFGLSSTMMFYDGNAVLVESFKNSDYAYAPFRTYYEVECSYGGQYSYTDHREALFTPAEVASFGDTAFGAYRSYNTSIANLDIPIEKSYYYQPSIAYYAALPEDHPIRVQLGDSYPEGLDEIAVSSYFLDCAENGTFFDINVDEDGRPYGIGSEVKISSEADLIGKRIPVRYAGEDVAPKVTAVFDDGGIPEKYEALKESSFDAMLQMDFGNFLPSSLATVAFVSQEYIDAYADGFMSSTPTFVPYFPMGADWLSFKHDSGSYEMGPQTVFETASFAVYDPEAELKLPVTLFGEAKGKSSLEKDQFVLPLRAIGLLFNSVYEEVNPAPTEPEPFTDPMPEYPGEEPTPEQFGDDEEGYREAHAEWERKKPAYDAWLAAQEAHDAAQEAYHTAELAWSDAYVEFFSKIDSVIYPAAEDEVGEEAKEFFASALEEYAPYFKLAIYHGDSDMRASECTVVGYYLPPEGNVSYNEGVYCSQSFYDSLDGMYYNDRSETTAYTPESDATFLYLFAPIEKTDAALSALFARLGIVDERDVYYQMNNRLYDNITVLVNTIIDMLSQVFLWVGVVLALFASLMLFNFISMSISNKKKEIGILRAVGARGVDVFKIFFAESGIIVLICTVISLIGSVFMASFLNGILKAEAGIEVALFVFGPLSALLMMALALAIALISTFLPVWLAARKKPVESIRAL